MDRNGPRLAVIGCLLLVVATALVYSAAARHSFVSYDDQNYVTENDHVQAGLTWATFTWALTATEKDNWHPLTWLSHALDCQLYGLNGRGHHVTSVLLHLINVLLLFFLWRRITGAAGRSLLVAAFFALHPLNVESVAWIAERKNVLSTLFFLLGLYAYVWYTVKPNVRRYLAMVACFALGLASKPMVITFPFVLLLLDFWPLQRVRAWDQPLAAPNRRKKNPKLREDSPPKDKLSLDQKTFSQLVLEKLPLLVLCVASAIITIVAQQSGGAVRTLVRFPLWMRLENAIYAYGMYLVKAFWPVHLAVYYPYPGVNLRMWQLALSALLLASMSVLVWKYRLSRRYLVTGWLWYLGTMVPVIGIIQVGDQAMADRYAYVPMIGVFTAFVWTVSEFADRRHISYQLRAAITVAVLAILSLLTWRQIGYWSSDYDLWSHTLAVTENNVAADENLGRALLTMGRADEALPRLRAAAQRNPWDPTRHANLGANLVQCGRIQDAIAEYTAAIQSSSDPEVQIRCYETLATLYDLLGDFTKVRESYRQALEIDRRQAPVMAQRLSDDLATDPSAAGYVQLGILLEESGQQADARSAYQQAIQLDPSLAAEQLLNGAGHTP